MKRAPSPFLIVRSRFKEIAVVGGSSFSAASLVSKSLAIFLEEFAPGLTATLFVHAHQVMQQIATVMNAAILWLCIGVLRVTQKTVKTINAVQH